MAQAMVHNPTCYGVNGSHAPTEMDETENQVGDTQYQCPKCSVTIEL